VAVFSRNATSGALSFVEVKQDGVGGVDGLSFAQSVTVSPDGKQVYATGIISLAVFSRNTTTGSLSFVQVQRDGFGGVDGLAGAADVTISPDGKHAYVAGGVDDAVAIFNRNTTNGLLSFLEAERNNGGGNTGLDFIDAVVVSPNSRHLYTGSLLDNAVAVFGIGTSGGSSVDIPLAKRAAAPAGFAIDGSWGGTTSFSTQIAFTIVNREVSFIGINACNSTFTFEYQLDRPKIAGNTIHVEETGAFGFTLHGTFTSPSSASGTVTLDNAFCQASGSWAASKQ
jgi:hypothetical protein